MASLKIGILGTRGIPNRYGGFEQCAEKLALGLVAKGHEVWVYNSSRHEFQGDRWNGVHIVHCTDPEDRLGTAGQFLYDWNCFRDARRRDYDVLLQLGYTSSSVWYRWWPRTCPNVVNMDGLEWMRSKYSPKVRWFLQHAERWAARKGDLLIADSTGIQAHLKERYGKGSVYIPYGAEPFTAPDAAALTPYGVAPHAYDLLIARMEPENNIEAAIRGHLAAAPGHPLLVVGGTATPHGGELTARYGSEPSIRFLGAIYDQSVIDNLRHFSRLYFHGHSVGGTNPSLLEAMACEALIAAHDNPFNRAILGDDALYFTDGDSAAALLRNFSGRAQYVGAVAHNAQKIRDLYNWPRIVDAYEAALQRAVSSWPSSP